ncbi:hypothetical protein [Geobacter sp. SVR]|uniref:hypothetical protein n=1 Tax=Geobacter sp. SVR TaxID=2495594 RepID=UPI00143F0525|nr:hypothetical protein [Geobacter sp. SVR]BCS54597.1 hypothetical protein GSVR_29050 [Geobacter sp. SVR]GCF86896.1 hypothetical protein GSbR_34960 [Geobacter sp. SVR]
MAKGYVANRERLEEIAGFGKGIGKRAGFACEWCGGKDDLRVWDQRPDLPPGMETLALLCLRCRGWADGRQVEPRELRAIRDALWSDVPAVAEGAARVLSRCREPWVREAIEESFIDETVKTELLK